MQIWTKSSYENVFQDTPIPWVVYDRDYNLVMAKNEYESFQIMLRSEDSFTIRSVTFSDPAHTVKSQGDANMSHNSGADELKKDEKQALKSEITLEDGREAFWDLREIARNNGIQDMSLEEINTEIQAVRIEMRKNENNTHKNPQYIW